MSVLRVVLHYHLSEKISSLIDYKDGDIIFLCECVEQLNRVKHHKKKLVLWLSSMRHFADLLRNKNKEVIYIKIDDKNNSQSLLKEIQKIINLYSFYF